MRNLSLSLSLSFVLDWDIKNRVWDWELLEPKSIASILWSQTQPNLLFHRYVRTHFHFSKQNKILHFVMPFFTMIFHSTIFFFKFLFKFLKNCVHIWFYLDLRDDIYFLVIKIDDVTPLVDFKDLIRFFVSIVWPKILKAYFWVLLPLQCSVWLLRKDKGNQK